VPIELAAWRRRPRIDRVKEFLCDQLREQI
jgi:hypothetical protein